MLHLRSELYGWFDQNTQNPPPDVSRSEAIVLTYGLVQLQQDMRTDGTVARDSFNEMHK